MNSDERVTASSGNVFAPLWDGLWNGNWRYFQNGSLAANWHRLDSGDFSAGNFDHFSDFVSHYCPTGCY